MPRGCLPVFVLLVALTAAAYAHSMYQSDVQLDFFGNEIHAELQLLLERLGTAFGKPIHAPALEHDRAALTAYVLSRFRARTRSASGAAR